MMTRRALYLLVVLFVLLGYRDGWAKNAAILTADGDPLPKVEPAKIKPITVPFAGAVVGQDPSTSGLLSAKDTPWEYEKRKALIDGLLHSYVGSAPDEPLPRYQYYIANGFGGAGLVGFDLTNGRVTRIGLHFPRRPNRETWTRLIRSMPNPSKPGPPGVIVVGSATVWRDTFRADGVPVDVTIRQNDTVAAQMEDRYLLEMEINRAYWYIAYHAPTPQVAAALRNGSLLPGMSEEEVGIAMGRRVKATTEKTDDPNIKRITYSHLIEVDGEMFKQYARFKVCTFKGGKLTVIQDVPDELEPPVKPGLPHK